MEEEEDREEKKKWLRSKEMEENISFLIKEIHNGCQRLDLSKGCFHYFVVAVRSKKGVISKENSTLSLLAHNAEEK